MLNIRKYRAATGGHTWRCIRIATLNEKTGKWEEYFECGCGMSQIRVWLKRPMPRNQPCQFFFKGPNQLEWKQYVADFPKCPIVGLKNRNKTGSAWHAFPEAPWKRNGPEIVEKIQRCTKCGLEKKLKKRIGATEPKIIEIRPKGGKWQAYTVLPDCIDQVVL